MDDGERVQPWQMPGLHRVQRWRHGHPTHHALREVTLGRLPDGRWLVEHSDVTVPSLAYRGEQAAWRRVAELTSGEGWVEVPAEFGPRHEPVDPGWRRSGGTWIPEG